MYRRSQGWFCISWGSSFYVFEITTMASRKKAIGFWVLTWLIPFIVSIPFYGKGGVPMIDIFLLKTIMIITWAGAGGFLLVKYFQTVQKNYLKESVFLGLIWLLINWFLDFTILLPMSSMTLQEYMMQIGLRYLMIVIFSVSIGALLSKKL